MGVTLIVLGLTSLLYCTTSASFISFTSTPQIVAQDLTKQLTLRCSVSDTISTTSTSAPNVRHTTTKIGHVTSIVVTRGDSKVNVAAVSQYDAAHPLVDFDSLRVTGGVTANGTEKAFLQMTWTHPGVNQSDSYTCEVNGVDAVGHGVASYTSLEVGIRSGLEELVLHIHDLESDLKATKAHYEAAISAVNTQLANSWRPHIEHGNVGCGDSGSWPVKGDGRTKTINIAFTRPYMTTPIVTLGLAQLDDEPHTRVVLFVSNVNTLGFQLNCRTWASSHVYGTSADWLSINP